VWAEVKETHPTFSIYNFHYPRLDPNCVTSNYHLNKVIGCNETGFDGAADEIYRIQAWQFILAGGGLFSHLDVSFRAGDEAGSKLPAGVDKFGGGPRLRRQLHILKDFIENLDFIHMAPDNSIVVDRGDAEAVCVLADAGKQYAVYVLCQEGKTGHAVKLRVPAGQYVVEYVDVYGGETINPEMVTALNGDLRLELPEFQRDIAVRINS
jgi:hypothetical protein